MLIRSSTCGFHKMEIIPFICTWWIGKGPIALGSSVFGSGINNNTSCPGWLSCDLCFKLSRRKFSSINHFLFWLANKGISRNMSWWITNSPGNTFIVWWMATQCVCWLVPCSSQPYTFERPQKPFLNPFDCIVKDGGSGVWVDVWNQ
jgi:hypothetical protein